MPTDMMTKLRYLTAAFLFARAMGAQTLPAPVQTTGAPLAQAGTSAFRKGATVQMTSDANYPTSGPLTFPQTSAGFIVFTSSVSLTAPRTITLPTCTAGLLNYEISIENLTTGSQPLYLGASTNSVPNGTGAIGSAKCDGTTWLNTSSSGGGTPFGGYTSGQPNVPCATSTSVSANCTGTQIATALGTAALLNGVTATTQSVGTNNNTLATMAALYAGIPAALLNGCYQYTTGAYNSGTTYPCGAIVTTSGGVYYSLANGNVGNTPATSPSYWQWTGFQISNLTGSITNSANIIGNLNFTEATNPYVNNLLVSNTNPYGGLGDVIYTDAEISEGLLYGQGQNVNASRTFNGPGWQVNSTTNRNHEQNYSLYDPATSSQSRQVVTETSSGGSSATVVPTAISRNWIWANSGSSGWSYGQLPVYDNYVYPTGSSITYNSLTLSLLSGSLFNPGLGNSIPCISTNSSGIMQAGCNISGGTTGAIPYQTTSGVTAFVASPTTSGHTYALSWQPSGSAVNPAALDLATYLASPPVIGGTTPASGSFTTLSATGLTAADTPVPFVCLSGSSLSSSTIPCEGTSVIYTQLSGTTSTITGTTLTSSCDSGTATVTGAVVGHTVGVSATTGADVGGAFNIRASVTSANTVTVYVCGTGTPASLAYNVTTY